MGSTRAIRCLARFCCARGFVPADRPDHCGIFLSRPNRIFRLARWNFAALLGDRRLRSAPAPGMSGNAGNDRSVHLLPAVHRTSRSRSLTLDLVRSRSLTALPAFFMLATSAVHDLLFKSSILPPCSWCLERSFGALNNAAVCLPCRSSHPIPGVICIRRSLGWAAPGFSKPTDGLGFILLFSPSY